MLYYVVLIYSLHYARNLLNLLEFLAKAFCASFSMLDGPGGTECNVTVHSCWDSRDVIVAAVCDFVKDCMEFVMYLII